MKQCIQNTSNPQLVLDYYMQLEVHVSLYLCPNYLHPCQLVVEQSAQDYYQQLYGKQLPLVHHCVSNTKLIISSPQKLKNQRDSQMRRFHTSLMEERKLIQCSQGAYMVNIRSSHGIYKWQKSSFWIFYYNSLYNQLSFSCRRITGCCSNRCRLSIGLRMRCR